MTSLPERLRAPIFYPATHHVEIDANTLRDLERPRVEMHRDTCSRITHWISEKILLLPLRKLAQWGALVKAGGNPGADKDKPCKSRCRQLTAGVGVIVMVPLAPLSLIAGMATRCAVHRNRPIISVLATDESHRRRPIFLTEEKPLHISSRNFCLVPHSTSNDIDMRDPVQRAHEIARWHLTDAMAPQIVFAQEMWNEDAVKTACEQLKTRYSFIVHNVAPQVVGMNASVGILSQHRPTQIVFERFDHMVWPHNYPPRGILKARFSTQQGPLLVYNIHTQSMREVKHARARLKQMMQLHAMVVGDRENEPQVLQLLVGDFNSPLRLETGEPVHEAERDVHRFLAKHYDDLHLIDHDENGVRTSGEPRFLASDCKRMGVKRPESQGTWENGKEGKYRHIPWGIAPRWLRERIAESTKYDFGFVPKGSRLTGRSESRYPFAAEDSPSGCTDHHALDMVLWVKA